MSRATLLLSRVQKGSNNSISVVLNDGRGVDDAYRDWEGWEALEMEKWRVGWLRQGMVAPCCVCSGGLYAKAVGI